MTDEKTTESTITKPAPTREEIELHRQKRLQNMGEWLQNNRTALFAIQATLCTAMCEWVEDDSTDADETAIWRMRDNIDLFIEIIAKLRNTSFCPDHKD